MDSALVIHPSLLAQPLCALEEDAMNTHASESEALLTPAEVAAMFRVDPKTVTRWAKAGKLSSIRTLGGHRRYRESEVRALLTGMVPEQRQPGADA
jgi:excisionase family DNA binding protein